MKKKVFSALALAAVAAGFASAADLTVKSEIKFQPKIAEFGIGDTSNTVNYWTVPSPKDTVVIQLKEGPVTVYGKFDLTAPSTFAVNTSYAKLAWGDFNIQGGYGETRYTNRVTTDQNDLSLIEQNYATGYAGKTGATKDLVFPGNKKLGVNPNIWSKGHTGNLNGTSYKKPGVDVNSVTSLEASKVGYFMVDYTLKDMLPGDLLLRGVAKANTDAWTNSTDEVHENAAFSFEAAFKHEMANADIVVNLDQDKVGSLGVFVQPTVMDELTAVVGFTFGWDARNVGASTTTKTEYVIGDGSTKATATTTYTAVGSTTPVATGTAITAGTVYKKTTTTPSEGTKQLGVWAIDARARYQISEELAAGLYANWSIMKLGGADAVHIPDFVLNGNYKLSEIAKVFVEGEFTSFGGLTDSDIRKVNGFDVIGQLGVILTPSKGATLTTAFRGTFAGLGSDDREKTYGNLFSIPLSFKCSL